jgi:5-methylcytosine-specific restriction enzyme A
MKTAIINCELTDPYDIAYEMIQYLKRTGQSLKLTGQSATGPKADLGDHVEAAQTQHDITLVAPVTPKLVLYEYDVKTRNGRIPLVLRHEVFKRCEYKCVECGRTKQETSLEIDHIMPLSLGGTDELSNLQILCKNCNIGKRNRVWSQLIKT